jgi:WhiB family redox-sensing transcriptional regulator
MHHRLTLKVEALAPIKVGVNRKNYIVISFFPSDYPDFTEFGEAPCSSSFPDAFFSEEPPEGSINKRGTYTMEREAKLVCAECPYKARCLEYALKNPELTGIWGGTTEYQRKALRKGKAVNLSIPTRRNR